MRSEGLGLVGTDSRSSHSSVVADDMIPDPLDSAEQWESYHHMDLEHLARFELLLTRTRLFMRLARDPKPHPWLLERLNEVQRRLKDER